LNFNYGKFSPGTWLNCGPQGPAEVYPTTGDPNCVHINGDPANPYAVNVGGYTFAGSPKWKFVEFAEYHHSLGAGDLEGFVQFDATYSDEIRYQIVADPGSTASASWKLGARIGVRSEDGHWGISVFGRNLLDQRIPTAIWDTTIAGYVNSKTSKSSALGYDSFRRIGISLDANY
jgi:iron complex outermembrane recepter protein